MSRQFATNVTTIYDIFCPVPFLPSPFGFRREKHVFPPFKWAPLLRRLDLDGCFSSENPTMIRVTLLCGQVLSERALWLLLGQERYIHAGHFSELILEVRNTPSTAGNSMTGSGRPSPEPLLKKEAPPAVLGGRQFWKCSGSLNCLEL